MNPFGLTRSVIVPNDHALIAPDSHVRTRLPGWSGAEGVVQIAPVGAMNGARFSQYLVYLAPGGMAGAPPSGIERVLYVLAGVVELQKPDSSSTILTTGGYAFIPADVLIPLKAREASELLVFEKRYTSLPHTPSPEFSFGQEQSVTEQPFMGDDAARLKTLLPDTLAFDLAVNIFTYDPGATLPFVESHIMEHGLLMIAGEGIYRLGEKWYPVRTGDAIWMASYCPQWFAATGKTPARYIYYKDVNRDSLEAL
jgi:(S)-ureidoglycine aminohydrolase